MTVEQLNHQLATLSQGDVVVYWCRRIDGGTGWLAYAAKLSKEGEDFFVTCSSQYNLTIPGVIRHGGDDVKYPIPADGWEYKRIVAADVHANETALRQIQDLERENAALRSQVSGVPDGDGAVRTAGGRFGLVHVPDDPTSTFDVTISVDLENPPSPDEKNTPWPHSSASTR
jgi:hypothetical protein